MLNRRDIIYTYDGSLYGLFSAIFDCYVNHDYPVDIRDEFNMQNELFCEYFKVETNIEKAERVINSVIKKMSPEALYHIYCVYLSCLDDTEMIIFDFIADGYKFGFSTIKRLSLDSVNRLLQRSQKISSEAHLYRGFVRFKKLKNGIYYSEIEPKCKVLPLLIKHFSERFSSIPFIIHDLAHKECLVYNGKSAEIREVDCIPHLQLAEDEEDFQELWREFYNSVEIKERHNEKCRMSMLPKRYWRFMTEFEK